MALKVAAVSGDASLRRNRRSLGIPANTAVGRPESFGKTERDQWSLLATAARLMNDKIRLNKAGDEISAFKYRVAMCHRGTQGDAPRLYTNPKGNRAEYRGLQTCGSVWHCPMCAAKISSKRRGMAECPDGVLADDRSGRGVPADLHALARSRLADAR